MNIATLKMVLNLSNDKTVTLRAADGVNIVFERSAVSAVHTKEEE